MDDWDSFGRIGQWSWSLGQDLLGFGLMAEVINFGLDGLVGWQGKSRFVHGQGGFYQG